MLFDREIEPQIQEFDDGSPQLVEYFNLGELSNPCGPAYVRYAEPGLLLQEAWLIRGKYHRADGPAWIMYKANGAVKRQQFYYNGVLLSLSEYLKVIPTKNVDAVNRKYRGKTATLRERMVLHRKKTG